MLPLGYEISKLLSNLANITSSRVIIKLSEQIRFSKDGFKNHGKTEAYKQLLYNSNAHRERYFVRVTESSSCRESFIRICGLKGQEFRVIEVRVTEVRVIEVRVTESLLYMHLFDDKNNCTRFFLFRTNHIRT